MLLAKIIAAIMAIFMALIPGYTPPEDEPVKPVKPPVQQVVIASGDIRIVTSRTEVMDYNYSLSPYVIISSYEDWKACALGESDTFYDETFFETKSLVVCGVALGNSSLELNSVRANKTSSTSTTLNVYYTIKSTGDIGAAVMCYKDIIIAVDKTVTNVKITISR